MPIQNCAVLKPSISSFVDRTGISSGPKSNLFESMEHESLLPVHATPPPSEFRTSLDRVECVETKSLHHNSNARQKRRCLCMAKSTGICILGICIGFFLCHFIKQSSSEKAVASASSKCVSPQVRREWRSLSADEKDRYLNAVSCLQTKPSRLGLNHSLYDDFPYVHYQFNEEIHFAAAFLPWHRYFIYTYHQALNQECQYAGELPYWDWTLDWENLWSAPVWDLDHGFSGNGRANDGRLANLQAMNAGEVYSPHCLTRDFGSGEPVANLSQQIRPGAIEEPMQQDHYHKFLVRLEARAHLAIPKFIMGDFRLFTSPNDPIFFLHHAQLDRIWWRWQQHDYPHREASYNGPFKPKSKELATIDDDISIGGLAPKVKFSALMDFSSAPLCYRY